jgi:transcriptional regulator with XRE-family HTH domain
MSIIPGSSSTHVAFLNLAPSDSSKEFPSESANAVKPPLAVGIDANASFARANSPNPAQDRAERVSVPTATTNGPKPKLHRIAEVRVSQGISERTMCRRLNIDVKQLRALEDPTSEIPLSMILEIREALDVPVADLLIESDGLARPVQERAKLLKIMKTAVSLKECKLTPRAARLAEMLGEQLIELMPELAHVGGWPEFGSRRNANSIARILSDEIDTSQLGAD